LAFDSAYSTRLLPAPEPRASRRAFVMHATFQGRFVALTIRVPGSSWVCHPSKEGDDWRKPRPYPTMSQALKLGSPPRWVRKEAKLALRRWLKQP